MRNEVKIGGKIKAADLRLIILCPCEHQQVLHPRDWSDDSRDSEWCYGSERCRRSTGYKLRGDKAVLEVWGIILTAVEKMIIVIILYI